ncbi:MAG: serpin family protein [Planctomycetes bacterium]|nr:serpin family protein [Planctomycetota bacterium]
MHRPAISRRNFLTATGAAAFAGFVPSSGRADAPAADPLEIQKIAAKAINAFAADLYSRLADPKSEQKGNLFFSPFSIETALAMTRAGARGKTLEEMEQVLHLPSEGHRAFGALIARLTGAGRDKLRSYELSVANAIWAQQGYPWEKAFLDLARTHYGAGAVEVNFAESEAARKRINEWVEKETNQKIKNLIGPGVITALTRMVLANAIHFKGNWLCQFDKKRTKEAPFTRDDGTKADVPLMALEGTFNHGETHLGGRTGLQVQILELPYASNDLSMLVFLPEKGRGVDRIASRLSDTLLAAPPVEPTEVKVLFPRFGAESELSLKPVLTDMGMKLAFGGGDFTGMSPKGKELYISHVLHKAFVEVNEEGTEAAAATAVVISEPKAPPKPAEFRADRPFVYAIRDNATGAALFLGRYTGPAR